MNIVTESDLSQSIVEVKDVSFSRGDRVIYKNMSFSVPKGKITAIMGPSGIGKTTMLRLIGGQLKPDSGDILFEGGSIPSMTRSELYEARTKMSMLFQSGALFTDMTVFDNVAFPIREHTTLPEDVVRTMVLLKLEAVGLRGARDLMPAELSGGMARRAALARSIALDPDLIMFDEPFVGQDPISMGVLVRLIRDLNSSLNLRPFAVLEINLSNIESLGLLFALAIILFISTILAVVFSRAALNSLSSFNRDSKSTFKLLNKFSSLTSAFRFSFQLFTCKARRIPIWNKMAMYKR